jgi:cysteine-rich repeat protein
MVDGTLASANLRRTRSVVATSLVTWIIAQPFGCSPDDSGEVTDGGGCNGGRSLPSEDESGESTGTDGTTEPATSESTVGDGVCGDGVVNEGEACDDGNKADDDGCPSGPIGGCEATATCGDGIVFSEVEACDDGNEVTGDGCEADCSPTPTAECGNGIMEAGEACDDSNSIETDACPSGPLGKCVAPASCGDGFVWDGMEGCDDANTSEEDECPSGAVGACAATASCGDGFVWAGMEGCDDANMAEDDGCPSGEAGQCVAEASCGDGFVWAGTEDCDDANDEDTDSCNDDCRAPRWVFISSTVGGGGLGGVDGADSQCQSLADGAGLGGTYMAWLTGSDENSAPATRFGSATFAGWYMLATDPPTPVARGWQELTSPNDDIPSDYLQTAIVIDENGLDVIDANAWTNTTPTGTRQGDDHCLDWSASDGDQVGQTGRAKSDLLGEKWTVNASVACNFGARLYCFQTG